MSIDMKPGHQKKFGFSIQQGREELKRENEEQEKQRDREEKQREREREEQDEQLKMEKQLAKIKRDQQLFDAQAKARSKRDQVDTDENSQRDAKSSTRNPASKGKGESKGIDLPPTKSYAAFISHKKTHSKQGDSSSTLARSLKVKLVCVQCRG